MLLQLELLHGSMVIVTTTYATTDRLLSNSVPARSTLLLTAAMARCRLGMSSNFSLHIVISPSIDRVLEIFFS